MGVSTKYDKNIEKKWIKLWQDIKLFESKKNSHNPYTIIMPPPNITGILHIGHILNNTIQDILIRKAKIDGLNTCWVPGVDHASIATEKKVIDMLIEKNIIKDKKDISKEDFLHHCRIWADKHKKIIYEQLKSLGIACDWHRNKFTMDKEPSDSVKKIFINLYEKCFIYKSYRMINWNPQAQTAISDEEVIHREVDSKLYYIKYKLEDEDKFVIIATTRPETILGDTAICVNPKDSRYDDLIGRKVVVPIANRFVNIIADEYVDMEFGTGCLKITPAHDPNDKVIGDKHNLETIDILNIDGTLNDNGLHYKNKDRFVVRKQIVKELEKSNAIEKIEDYKNKVGFSERTNCVIENRISSQWFVSMKKLVIPAIKAIEENQIKIFPSKFKKTYLHWLTNIKDWNISRQLYWGHEIPAYYFGKGDKDFVVANKREEALLKAKKINKNIQEKDIRKDKDVLDTWFSSWIWPISVFDGINNPKNEDISYYYPTRVIVSAPDILFFWIARMIIAGYEFRGEKPFEDIYLTGIVRDKNRVKMSKSLGNSPDPLDLISEFGADSLRLGVLLTSRAGNDLLFDKHLCEQGRNFCNKIWNAYRLIDSWEIDDKLRNDLETDLAIDFIISKLNQLIKQTDKLFKQYNLSEVLITLYKFVWDDFCSFYLEIIKPNKDKKLSKKTVEITKILFEKILKLLHPFIPFLTEEIWQSINKDKNIASICLDKTKWENLDIDLEIIKRVKECREIITQVRKIKEEKQVLLKTISNVILPNKLDLEEKFLNLISKSANVSFIKDEGDSKLNYSTFIVNNNKYKIILEKSNTNNQEELKNLKDKLKYNEDFLIMIENKLKNEKFIDKAPKKVIDLEIKKKEDTLKKIKSLKEEIKIFE